MHRVLALTRTVFFAFDLGRAAGDSDLGAIVEIVALGTLKPGHFAIFFCHDTYFLIAKLAPGRDPGLSWFFTKYDDDQAMTLVTTPEPTVFPPSRTAKRSFSSMAIGACNSTSIVTLSPGITISAPPSSLAEPVTS